MREFPTTGAMLEALEPVEPVYCIRPALYRAAAARFLDGFPGRVLYAVKANNVPGVIGELVASGIGHFDCASLPEIELVRGIAPLTACYFMTPVRIPGAASAAQRRFGVRHFMIDDPSGLAPLLDEIDARDSVIFVRMAVSHASAAQDLSSKFGAAPDTVGELLQAVDSAGAWELRFRGHKRYAVRAWRGGRLLGGEARSWTVFGPTCDSTDVLPAPLELPAGIEAGDYVEFDAVGAYSLSGRTDFNGFAASTLVRITGDRA